MSSFFAFLLLFICVESTKKKPILSSFGFPSSLTSGQRVIITCSVLEGDPPIRLFWLKDEQRVSHSDLEEVSMGDLGSSLVFRKVSKFHSGLYTCFAQNAFGNTSFSARMQVRVSPVWRVEPQDRAAVVGANVRFDCQSDGFPLPVIRWKLKTGSLEEFRPLSSNYRLQSLENGSLAISDVTKQDAGLYACESGNGVGGDISRVVKLTVHESARFKKAFQVIRAIKGDPIVVECEAFGEKPISIKWTRDRSDVIDGFSVTQKENSNSLVSRLSSSFAQRSDSGLFTCLAFNAFGQSETSSQVVVEEVPDSPNSLSLVSKGSRSASVQWKEPFDGNREIQKYLIQINGRVLETKETHLTFNDLEPLTEFKVRVRAQNAIGTSLGSEVLFVTEEEIPSSPPKEVRVTSLSSRSLKVNWKSANGRVRGYYVGFKSRDEKVWTFNTIENSLEFVVSNLERKTRYSVKVQAFNNKGAGPQSEETEGMTLAYDAPHAPQLFLHNTSDVTQVNLTWSVSEENPISGFRLFSRALPNQWQELPRSLEPSLRRFSFTQLECGKHFQFYVVAFNDLGSSPASAMVSRDLTTPPMGAPPPASRLLTINSTRVDLHLDEWRSPQDEITWCEIRFFRIKYKNLNSLEWSEFTRQVFEHELFSISGLSSGHWYCLLVQFHFSERLFSQKEYVFSTLTSSGATVSPMTALNTDSRRLSRYFIVLIPISCAISVLLVIGFVVIYICFRRTTETTTINEDSLSMTEIKKSEERFQTPYASSQLEDQKTQISNEYQTIEFCGECHNSHHCY